jgi:hypothetical protein
MIKQTNKIITDKNSKRIEKRTSRVTDYASQKTSPSKIHITDSNNSDDLIVSLANAYENKRAQQVNEWETLQRKAFSKAA